jgi:hypothetical protein
MQKISLPVNYQRVGSIDHPVRWDEEKAVAYRMKNSHATRITLIISYVVKQYLKLDKL